MFIENLLSLIKEKGITRKKLAEDLSFGVNQIKYWETHGNVPSGDIVQKIADYFNVTVDYLLTGEQKESPSVTPTDERVRIAMEHINGLSSEELDALIPLLEQMRKANKGNG